MYATNMFRFSLHIPLYMSVRINIYMVLHTYLYRHVYSYMAAYISVCMYKHLCPYMYVFICKNMMYIYISSFSQLFLLPSGNEFFDALKHQRLPSNRRTLAAALQ